MTLHLAEISQDGAPSVHAVLVLDGAGRPGAADLVVPENPSLPMLPPHAPELNRVESVRQSPHGNRLAISVLDSHAEIADECCEAWSPFVSGAPITSRAWETVGRQGR